MARNDIDKQAVLELREQGLTQQSIADRFGCSRAHIVEICGEHKSKRATDYKRVCQECGVLFMAGKNAKYCPKCRVLVSKGAYHNSERAAAKRREQQRKEMLAKKKPGFKPAKCPEDCIYLQRASGIIMCGYFLTTDELRGCDPGLGCKKYVGKNEDLKSAKHRKVTWDVVNGKKLWEAGWKDSMIAKVMRVKPDTVRSYRKRVWEAEKNHDST